MYNPIKTSSTNPTVPLPDIFTKHHLLLNKLYILTGTSGELSAGLIPTVLADMGLTLSGWELKLLQELVETSYLFGIIGEEWDEDFVRETFKTASGKVDVEFEQYIRLARRIYEADIITIYTESRLAGQEQEEVGALIDISERVDRLLGIYEPEVVPIEGAEKIDFFDSIVSLSPDFMRMISRAMDDDEYAARILPESLVALREISHENTSVIHRHPDTGRAINPFIHTLNVVNQLNVEGMNNIRALRIAALLHDIGKGQFVSYRDDGYKYHAEKSAQMVPAVLEQWGIRDRISDDEVILIQYLVERHDRLTRHTQPTMQWEWTIQKVTETIIPSPELQAKGFDFFTALRYVRRLQQADSDSIPKFRGTNDFDQFEKLFATHYISTNSQLWFDLSKQYSPNLPIKGKRDTANQFIALRVMGLDRGYEFIDQSDNLAEKELSIQPSAGVRLNANQLTILDTSL